jgi:HPt (histidine-containing phosphotransfer) domain-containing protein
VDVFLREAPAQLSALTQAADCRDPVRVRKAAHTLKGSCLALGAPQLAAACRVVESSAVRGQVDQRAIAQMPAQLALVQRLLTPDSLTDGK